MPATEKGRAVAVQRREIIRPTLRHPPDSAERASAVQAAVPAAGVSRAQLYEWLSRYEAEGLAGQIPR